jgi:maltose alpha-D-glucosyltransferase / alpha-amylase
VWLRPFYPSPLRDDGYDIADYYAIDPRLGTFGDFVAFLREARELGLRVISDLVVNHTSDQHPWFQAARSDPKSRYRDWYIWAKEKPHDPVGPVFPGVQKDTWTYDDMAKEYYHHRFYDFQPDLNTANREVRKEIEKVIGFWLELGLSGFRLDAVPFMLEHSGGANDPVVPYDSLHAVGDDDPYRLLRDLRRALT